MRAGDRESSPFLVTMLTCSSPHLGQGNHSPSPPPRPPPPRDASIKLIFQPRTRRRRVSLLPFSVSLPCSPALKLIQVAFLKRNFLTLIPASLTPLQCTERKKTAVKWSHFNMYAERTHRTAHNIYTANDTDKGS